MRAQGLLQVSVNDPRLNDRESVGYPDVNDLVHSREVENQASGRRDGSSGQTGSRSPGSHGKAVLIGKRQDPGYLFGGGGPDGCVGSVTMVRCVVRIGDKVNQRIGNVGLTDDMNEGLPEAIHHER